MQLEAAKQRIKQSIALAIHKRIVRLAGVLAAYVFVVSCESGPIYTDLRIYTSPYESVDWTNVLRLKAQHHDHIATNTSYILAYDAAGYDVVSLMDYSGNTSLSYAWQERLWPPDQWVPGWALSSLTSIKFFLPNAEEVGVNQHATSPFLTTYIEGKSASRVTGVSQYGSIPEMFSLVRVNDGFPCLAHPWNFNYENLQGAFCAEIFTAFAEAQRHLGVSAFLATDHNERLLANWDRALGKNQQVFGIAVNDHYGPYNHMVPDEVRDSGAIVVLAGDATPASYRIAFETGQFFAIRDTSAVKDQYPQVFSISVDDRALFIETTGSVRWISHGRTIGSDPVLQRTVLPPNSRYVRAEISGAQGDSVVFTQAFVVRPVGDIDGDYDIDDQDEEICQNVISGTETGKLRISACNALDNDQSP